MTPQQQSAWDTVYTASLCASGTGMVLTREQALVLLDIYRALYDHLPKPPTRTEWWITGHAANGTPLYSETARTEATRNSFYRSALGTAGVERVTIVAREVLA